MKKIFAHQRLALAALLGCGLFMAIATKLPAAFTEPKTETFVVIDGVNFGRFDRVEGIDQFGPGGLPVTSNEYYGKVRFKRDFVTDPSLYLWAKNRRSKNHSPKNIHLLTKSMTGELLKSQVLEMAQPLSWSVEAANPSIGGFNETIDLAVQKVSLEID